MHAHTTSYDDDNELHGSSTSHYLSWLSSAAVLLAHPIRTMWVLELSHQIREKRRTPDRQMVILIKTERDLTGRDEIEIIAER